MFRRQLLNNIQCSLTESLSNRIEEHKYQICQITCKKRRKYCDIVKIIAYECQSNLPSSLRYMGGYDVFFFMHRSSQNKQTRSELIKKLHRTSWLLTTQQKHFLNWLLFSTAAFWLRKIMASYTNELSIGYTAVFSRCKWLSNCVQVGLHHTSCLNTRYITPYLATGLPG